MRRSTRRIKRRPGRRTVRRSRRTRRAGKQMVARVAKRVSLGLSESKRFAIINEGYNTVLTTTAQSQWYYRSVFAPLGAPSNQGGTSYNIVGNEIQQPMMKLKFRCVVPWGSLYSDNAANFGSVGFTVMLVASNEQLAATTPASYASLTPDPGWFYNSIGWHPTMNGNNVKVLKKWTKLVIPEPQGVGLTGVSIAGTTLIRGSLRYRWKRKLTFEDTPPPPAQGGPNISRVLRGWNYYLLVGVTTLGPYGSTTIAGPPSLAMDSFLYYKDP